MGGSGMRGVGLGEDAVGEGDVEHGCCEGALDYGCVCEAGGWVYGDAAVRGFEAEEAAEAGVALVSKHNGLRQSSGDKNYLAGRRMEPPPSAPIANGTRPAATEYADPPDEPPV